MDRTTHTQQIFEQLKKITGESAFIGNLYIQDVVDKQGHPVMNAWATIGTNLMTGDVYMTESEMNFDYDHGGADAIALILSHEIAHITLRHIYVDPSLITIEIKRILEAQADKMGAFYMMKAGYDICRARENWKALEKEYGDNLLQDHPDFAYRYSQLNVGCTK